MRRPIVPALALVGLFFVAACGGPAAPSTGGSGPAASPPAASGPAASEPGAAAACAPATEPVTDPVAVAIADRAFDPDPVEAKVGDAIEWHNEDAVPHTATLDEGDCDTGQLIRGAKGALVFSAAGTFAYHCEIHSDMHGTITISP